MSYDRSFFDKPVNRLGTACEKWDGMNRREGRELLPMWVADMDFACPNEVVSALEKRAAHPIYGYTEQTQAAVDAMLGFMQRRHGLTLHENQQLMMPCVVTGLRAAVRALTRPGDRVIVQPPVYGPFYASVRDNGREIAENPLLRDENGRYHMDFDGLEKLCREGASLMMLCSPHNPVGRLWTRAELERLCGILNRYQVLLLSDEIHEDFVFEQGGFVPILSLDAYQKEDARVLSLTSASKTFNLAGLHQSVMFTRNASLKDAIFAEMQCSGVVQGNIFGMVAAEAAYRYGDAWLEAMLAYLKEARQILTDELKLHVPKAIFYPMEATYLGWLDLRAYGLSTDELMERTHAAGVAFTAGTFFGQDAGEGFLRINTACPHAQLQEAVRRLEAALK